MEIETFSGIHEIEEEGGLDRLLVGERFDFDSNSYWMRIPEFPQMVVLIRGQRACVHFFPTDGHPGFRSGGCDSGRDATEIFYIDRSYQTIELTSSAVISVAEARVVAKHFLGHRERSPAIEWYEL